MITDLGQAGPDPFKNEIFDVCVVGGGVAGITLALKLPARLRVCLLEAGGDSYSPESQELYQGKSDAGRPYFDLTATRQRFLGGTSNHWGGFCRPLDTHDFDAKPWLERSGWPISAAELKPYLAETRSILDIPPDDPAVPPWSRELSSRMEQSGDFRMIPFWRSAPTRFAEKYRADIAGADNIACFLNANATRFRLAEPLSSVESLEVRSYAGQRHHVRARRYVLATGGIENPRMLLNSDEQVRGGIGNRKGLVGRFFCEHPSFDMGRYILEDSLQQQMIDTWVSRKDGYRFFEPTPALMARESITNFNMYFVPSWLLGTSDFSRRLRDFLCPYKDTIESITGNEYHCNYDGDLRINWEQALNPDSRITLGNERDRFGLRRIRLDWRLTDMDIHTMRRAIIRFGEVFAAAGVGRVRVPDWILQNPVELPGLRDDANGGHHHMCTTRMADSAADGVVDRNLKVFDMDNLYVAGSSSFGSPGHANPTFTIVQMALRLADHLAGI